MKKIGLAILFLTMIGPSVLGQDPKCDCTITPFAPTPPCFDICSAKVLSTSTPEELQLILGIKKETAERIADWKGRKDAKTLDDFKKILTQAEIKEVSDKINSLSEPQLKYFNKSPTERETVREEMKDILILKVPADARARP